MPCSDGRKLNDVRLEIVIVRFALALLILQKLGLRMMRTRRSFSTSSASWVRCWAVYTSANLFSEESSEADRALAIRTVLHHAFVHPHPCHDSFWLLAPPQARAATAACSRRG